MGELLKIAVYNPAILDDQNFLACFVARQDVVERLLQRLAEIQPGGLAQHHVILGQRGMGKTSLLRRLALAIRDDPALSAVLLPLCFREEQYNVHNLRIFWCNCLDALADWFEKAGRTDQADAIDREIAQLAQSQPDPHGDLALACFKRWAKAEGKRPLLLLDNIDLVLNGLGRDERDQWSLRRVLQEAGGIVVVSASATYLEAAVHREAAFYDFFQVTVLEPLTQDDLLACLRRLAQARGDAGRKVGAIVDGDPGRIRTLHDLTGGNPRTLILLYLLLELDADGDVISDLERLLDQVTVLYKARVEDLPSQGRVILDAVALAWNPVVATEVATATGLETTTVSAQLDRLQRDGIVDKLSPAGRRRTTYQLSERFFNIWYLMRHGPRRQRTRLRWLTGFLGSFYSTKQLGLKARDLLRNNQAYGLDRSHYCLALSDAVEDMGWRNALGEEARTLLQRHAAAIGKRLQDIVDTEELPTPRSARDWAVHGKLLAEHLERYAEAEAAFRKAIELKPASAQPWTGLGSLLQYRLGRFEEAEAAYRKAIELEPASARPWNGLGDLLQDRPGRFEEAETAYRKAIELDPAYARAWNGLGYLLQYRFARFEEAEAAYRKAVDLDPTEIDAWCGLGFVCLYFLGRYDDAEAAYRAADQLAPAELVVRSNLLVLDIIRSTSASEVDAEFEALVPQHPPHGAALLQALRALSRDNFGAAAQAFEGALAGDQSDVLDIYLGFLVLLLREVAAAGYGDKLLARMDDTGVSDRYWPLRAAFDAYLHGEEKLVEVNPEVRGAAKRIYAWLDGARSHRATELRKPKPARLRRRRA